jgi:cbb3-type cytochrome oxidase maturation protein
VDIVYLMVPLGLVLVALGLWAFFWAVGSGQFDDLDSPGWSVLKDDTQPPAAQSPAAQSLGEPGHEGEAPAPRDDTGPARDAPSPGKKPS